MDSRIEKLTTLNQMVNSCQACEISLRRRNAVFGEGNPFSQLVIVGEGPGNQEDATGRPFLGRAGKLLDKAIFEAGLDRNSLYITNTVRCRACDWVEGKPVNRAPTNVETSNCLPWLLQQLEIINPKIVLCVGGASAKVLISKNFKITTERGQIIPTSYPWNAIATLHPSYIMRLTTKTSDGGFNHLVNDLKLAWNASLTIT